MSGDKKRVFLALKLSTETQQQIKKWQQEHAYLGVRFPPAEHLHVTIVPPFEIEDAQLSVFCSQFSDLGQSVLCLSDKLTEGLKTGELATENRQPKTDNELIFDHISYGPDQNDIHLIWATGQAPEWVLELRRRLDPTLTGEYLLHVTIARFPKHLGQSIAKQFPIDETVNRQSKIDTLALVESRLKSPVAQYETLAEYSL